MNVPSWMSLKKLALNIPKIQMLQFNHISNVQFKGVNLVNDDSARYLGIHIDTKLSSHHLIKHAVKKLSKQLSVIARLRHYVPRGTLLNFYQTYIEPTITYGLLVCGCTSRHQLNPTYIIQKKVLRFFHCKPHSHPSRELFFQNGFLNVFELYSMELPKFCPKSVRGDNCFYFLNSFHETRFNVHETRSVSSGAFYHLRTSNLREEQSVKNRGSKVIKYKL